MVLKDVAENVLLFTPSAPCFDCHHSQRCKTELIACEAFYRYVELGRGRGRRHPNREIYELIYTRGLGADHHRTEP